jgi:ankyrin repeat protein
MPISRQQRRSAQRNNVEQAQKTIYHNIVAHQYDLAKRHIEANPHINLNLTVGAVFGSEIRKSGITLDISDIEKFTPLIFAIISNNEEFALYLLNQGVAYDTNFEEIGTPLYLAIQLGYSRIINALLQKPDINLNRQTPAKVSYLTLSIGVEDYLTARKLIEKGVNPNAESEEGITPLLAACFADPINAEFVQFLIKQGADINQRIKGLNISFLTLFIIMQKLDFVKLFLEKGAKPNLEQTFHPLQLLLAYPNDRMKSQELAILKAFIEHKVDLEHITDKRKEYDLSALHLAAAFNKRDIIRYLLDGKLVDPNIKGYITMRSKKLEHTITVSNWTPLHSASSPGRSMVMVKQLLDKGAKPLNVDSLGCMPLHWAAYSDNYAHTIHLEQLQKLQETDLLNIIRLTRVEKNKGIQRISINTIDENFLSMQAETEGARALIVRVLLETENGKQALYHQDQEGELPLHKAVYHIANVSHIQESALRIVKALLKADTKKSTVHTVNQDGETPFHVLAHSISDNTLLNETIEKIIIQLIEAGADPDLENKAGQTPFSIMPEAAQALIQKQKISDHRAQALTTRSTFFRSEAEESTKEIVAKTARLAL